MPRASGVLMHVTSLPGSDSIGCFGKEARDFIDFLSDSGFTWWQVLPFCMADECNSPYKSYSAFGGNPYLVDLRILAADASFPSWPSPTRCARSSVSGWP